MTPCPNDDNARFCNTKLNFSYFFLPHVKKRDEPKPAPQHHSPNQRRAHKRRRAGNAPARQAADNTDGNGTANPQQQRRKPNARNSHDNATERRQPQGHGRPTARHGRTNDARPEQNGDNGQRPAAHQDEDPAQTATQQGGRSDNSRRKAATSATKAETHTAKHLHTQGRKKRRAQRDTKPHGAPQTEAPSA